MYYYPQPKPLLGHFYPVIKLKLEITKQWFNADCCRARKNGRKIRRKYKLYGTRVFNSEFQRAQIKYKRILNKSYKVYRNNLQRNIKALRSSNPREYWKLMHDKSSNEYNDISAVDFYDYFKTVNANEHDSDSEVDYSSLNDRRYIL